MNDTSNDIYNLYYTIIAIDNQQFLVTQITILLILQSSKDPPETAIKELPKSTNSTSNNTPEQSIILTNSPQLARMKIFSLGTNISKHAVHFL